MPRLTHLNPSAYPPARTRRSWKRPPAELVRFVRSLAVDDARRDHDIALTEAGHRANPKFTTIDRGPNRR